MSDERLFLRRYLGQSPSDDLAAALPASPDVIPVGATPVPDPRQFATPESYDSQPPVELLIGRQNCIYARVRNSGGQPREGRLWLFRVTTDLALWPHLWSADGIGVDGEARNWVDLGDVPGGEVGVTAPFTWSPPLGPLQQSLIAFVEQTPLSEPPRDPRPTAPFGSWEALAQWLRSTPDVAWLSIGEQPVPGAPTWQATVKVTGAPEGGRFAIGVVCRAMPTDGFFAFSVPGYDAASTAIYPSPPTVRAPIFDADLSVLVWLRWRAGFTSSITLSWWSGATPPPPGSSISPLIAMPGSSGALRVPLFLDTALEGTPEPTPMTVLGDVSYRFRTPASGTTGRCPT